MSEFSESYHLRASRAEEAVALLREAGVDGYVLPARNGWVTFVAAEGEFVSDKRIVQANPGILLHYVFAEDHEWSFAVFERQETVLRYRCDWNNELRVDASQCSDEGVARLISQYGTGSADDVVAKLHPADLAEAIEGEAAYCLAKALGLEFYEWTSYDGVADDPASCGAMRASRP